MMWNLSPYFFTSKSIDHPSSAWRAKLDHVIHTPASTGCEKESHNITILVSPGLLALTGPFLAGVEYALSRI